MNGARTANRLATETSPYLLSHSQNPVDWYPWGQEALDRARKEQIPILLSVGYAACHWCHVMERESFEDEETAALMNEHFVCIKVDREQRPDIDSIYMAATVAMNGSGGWPMTVFMAPDGRPFFTGTYFPPEDRYGRPGFKSLLRRIASLWKEQRDALLGQAEKLREVLVEGARVPPPAALAASTFADAMTVLEHQYDDTWGGFGKAPKFPPCTAIALLFRIHARNGSERALEMALGTLRGMRRGGMYDHLGGGFARYSTDDRWHVPHFEKMLYDNAQLARVYLEGYQVTGDADLRRVAVETLDYVVREMQSEEGGYFCATDADSEGVEGKFFVFDHAELAEYLSPEEARCFAAAYDVRPEGNWEGVNVLWTPRPFGEIASELSIDASELDERLSSARAKLLEARGKRVPPLLDDKVLTSWNGLMIGAMADGFRVLRDRRYLDSALRAAAFLERAMVREDGGLFRAYREGKAQIGAFLEDYAYLTDALIDLYEAGAPRTLLDRAERIATRLIADFADETGPFFHTARDHEELLVRPREGHDGALVNPSSIAVKALLRLSLHGAGDASFQEVARRSGLAYSRQAARAPRGFASLLMALEPLYEPPVEIGIAGGPDAEELWAAVAEVFVPNRIIAHGQADDAGPPHPLFEGKDLALSAVYVCRDFACQAPVKEASGVRAALIEATAACAEARRDRIALVEGQGGATSEGTRELAGRFGDRRYAELSTSGGVSLAVSRVGFGGYRIDRRDAHRRAIERALGSGINVFDTSPSYTDGESERAIGEALSETFRMGKAARGEVVLLSKVGLVDGPNRGLVAKLAREGHAPPELEEISEHVAYCLHPSWIRASLMASLGRTGCAKLDGLFVMSPELLLGRPGLARRDVKDRLCAAFACLHELVQEGEIAFWGVSSAGLVRPGRADTLSLHDVLDAANEAGARASLGAVQVPFNLLEPELLSATDGAPQTPMGLSARLRQERIVPMGFRPLNAAVHDRLVRLVLKPPAPPLMRSGGGRIAEVAALEAEYRETIASRIATDGDDPVQIAELLNVAEMVERADAAPLLSAEWAEYEQRRILPPLRAGMRALSEGLPPALQERWQRFAVRYADAVEALLAKKRREADERTLLSLRELVDRVEAALPNVDADLDRIALAAAIAGLENGVALAGLRGTPYVEAALASWQLAESEAPMTEVFEHVDAALIRLEDPTG